MSPLCPIGPTGPVSPCRPGTPCDTKTTSHIDNHMVHSNVASGSIYKQKECSTGHVFSKYIALFMFFLGVFPRELHLTITGITPYNLVTNDT